MTIHPAVTTFQQLMLKHVRRSIRQAPVHLEFGQVSPLLSKGTGSEGTGSERVVIQDAKTLASMLIDPEVGFGDAYMEGRIKVEGDLVRALEVVLDALRRSPNKSWFDRLTSGWLQYIQANTLDGSISNIHRHYDLDTAFYKLWLDAKLIYTCAYFPKSSATLEEAQWFKMEHICRKLRLKPGERVVDAGCGWGALAMHMAKFYGTTVQAFNISHEQIQYAQAQARLQGLSDRVEFIERDYRTITGSFDVFVSIGMLEHVGREHYGSLEETIYRSVGDAGRGLIHFIGRNRPEPFSTWIRKRIFPGAYVPSLREALGVFEKHDYAVLDVENLRLHYAKTLEHWLDRFEHSADVIVRSLGIDFFRAWELYLASSIASFRIGQLQLFQVLFAGSECVDIPWTRDHLYANDSWNLEETRCAPVTF